MRFWIAVTIASALLYNIAFGAEGANTKWLEKRGWVRYSLVDTKGKLSRVYTRNTAEGKQQWLVCPIKQNCTADNTDECIEVSRCKNTNSELKAETMNPESSLKFIDVHPTEEKAVLQKYATLDNWEELDRLTTNVVDTCEVDDIFKIADPEKVKIQVNGIINSVVFVDSENRVYSCMLYEDEECQQLVSEGRNFRECISPQWCVRYIHEGEKKDCK